MSESSDLRDLTDQIRKLVDRLGTGRSKDWTDRLAVVSGFISTVIVALLGLIFTQQARTAEERRQREYQSAQLDIQRAQVRIEELKALTSIAPLLGSRDSIQQDIARMILGAVNDSRPDRRTVDETIDVAPSANSGPGSTPIHVAEVSLLDSFIQRALNSSESTTNRVTALRRIEAVATSAGASPGTRDRALAAATEIVSAADTPEEVVAVASDVIARIQSVHPGDIAAVIAQDSIPRRLTEIIVHHTGAPFSISAYRGAGTILALARYQTGQMNLRSVSWHYAISPDGQIWLGMPLGQPAIHAQGRNQASISVLFFVDGEIELPTPDQRSAFRTLMISLEEKTGLSVSAPNEVLLHNAVNPTRQCPGRLIVRDSITAWVSRG